MKNVLFVMLAMLVGTNAFASLSYTQKVKIDLVNDQGERDTATLNLFVIDFENGTANLRDVSSANGDRFPILAKTGLMGMKYFFWSQGSKTQTALCNKIGFDHGKTSSVTNRFPILTKISDNGLSSDNTNLFHATSPNEMDIQSSLSIVDCWGKR